MSMTFREDVKDLHRKKVLRDVMRHQTIPHEHEPYGAGLTKLLEGVICTSERRKLMRLWFMQLAPNGGYVKLPVNRRWCWNTKDSDLQHLMSVGFLKIERWNKGTRKTSENDRQKRSGAFYSYLTFTGGER